MHIPDSILQDIIDDASTLTERYRHAPSADAFAGEMNPLQLFYWEQHLSRIYPTSYKARIASLGKLYPNPADKAQVSQSTSGMLPDWADFVKKALIPKRKMTLRSEIENTLPFASVLMPFAQHALEQIQVLPEADQYLQNDCLVKCQTSLLEELTELSSLAFFEHFNASPVLSYSAYLDHLEENGLEEFFKTYPSLARLIGQKSLDWIFGMKAFLSRLYQDYELITGWPLTKEGRAEVANITSHYSLPHNAYGPVRGVKFSDGRKVYYKPKPAETDAVYNSICSWVNTKLGRVELKPISLLAREGYCWQEAIIHAPLNNTGEADDYYRRAGYLVAITQVLGSTDYHLENVMACGAFPVLVDNETILAHEINLPVAPSPSPEFDPTTSLLVGAKGNGSQKEGGIPSGLFGTSYKLPYRSIVFKGSNGLLLKDGYILRDGNNIPNTGNKEINPSDHIDALCTGYAAMLRLIYTNKEAFYNLIAEATGYFSIPVRLVLRDTPWYWRMREALRLPENLKSGIDRSIEIEKLAAIFTGCLSDVSLLLLLQREMESMQDMYIPAFYIPANGSNRDDEQPVSLIRRQAQKVFEDNLEKLVYPGAYDAQVEHFKLLTEQYYATDSKKEND